MNKEVKKEIFNGLADWIVDNEPNYPTFEECKLWLKKQNSQYVISKEDKKEINAINFSSYESTNE